MAARRGAARSSSGRGSAHSTTIAGQAISHPDKVLFADAGITKGDLAQYAATVAAVVTRHLRDRPLMVQRFPRGVGESGFVQQDFADIIPSWMNSVAVRNQSGRLITHPVVSGRRSLVWLMNQDVIAVHSWLARRRTLDHPDQLVIDLDPSGNFGQVRRAAVALRDLLVDVGLVPFVKTTGSRGLHVVAPLRPESDFDTVRQFAADLAELCAAQAPDERTVEFRKGDRGKRVYLDVMRNAYGQTAVAPYAVRARPGAPVATPLAWDEVSSGLRPDGFTIADVPQRLARHGDPWATMARHRRSLTLPQRRLARLREDRS